MFKPFSDYSGFGHASESESEREPELGHSFTGRFGFMCKFGFRDSLRGCLKTSFGLDSAHVRARFSGKGCACRLVFKHLLNQVFYIIKIYSDKFFFQGNRMKIDIINNLSGFVKNR